MHSFSVMAQVLLNGESRLPGAVEPQSITADRDAAVGDVLVAGEMEGILRLIGRVRFTAFRGRPVP